MPNNTSYSTQLLHLYTCICTNNSTLSSLSLSDQNLLHTSTMQHLIQRINPPNFQRRRLHIADRQVSRLNSLQQQSGVCHKEMNKRTIRDFAWYDPEYNHQHFTNNNIHRQYLLMFILRLVAPEHGTNCPTSQ